MTTTTTRIAARDDFEWLEQLPRYLAAQRVDPTGLPADLADAITAYNEATINATTARNAYAAITESVFLAAIDDDRQADERAARAGDLDQPPANTAGKLLDDRRRLHREATTWTIVANQRAHDVVTLIDDHTDDYIDQLTPTPTPATASTVKAARTALEKLRPALAESDHANALAAWLRSIDSVDALTSRPRPQPGDPGPHQAALDHALHVLDQLTT